MKCPKCNRGKLHKRVSITVETNAENYNLSKTGIRSPSVKVITADWDHEKYYCDTCNWFVINQLALDRK